MAKIKVAINGCGRIGRAFLKLAEGSKEVEIVAVNDLADVKNIAYLLKYDSVYRGSGLEVEALPPPPAPPHSHPSVLQSQDISPQAGEMGGEGTATTHLLVNGRKILYFSEKEPENLPWKDLGVDIVVEASGHFTSYEKAGAHLKAGAKRVIITAPAKEEKKEENPSAGLPATPFKKGRIGDGENTPSNSPSKEGERKPGETVLMGVNEEKLKEAVITSNASCTTNAASPLIAILDEKIGIEKALLNTVHAYTASQGIVDGPNKKDFREGRAGAQNIVPSSTGAAIAVTKAFTSLAGLFDGIAIRVPVVCGSIVDITFVAKRETSKEEVNEILKNASKEKRWVNIFTATEEELVSSDILGHPCASIADLKMTRVVGGNLVKVLAWYDNEMGYTNTLLKHVIEAGKCL